MDLKNHSIPPASIKKIVKADGRVGGEKKNRTINPADVISVYIGHTGNLRKRLQEYGRRGSHLENGKSDIYSEDKRQLFQGVFSRGFPILFRYHMTDNKHEAADLESEILKRSDCAWNNAGNGHRRAAASSRTGGRGAQRHVQGGYGMCRGVLRRTREVSRTGSREIQNKIPGDPGLQARAGRARSQEILGTIQRALAQADKTRWQAIESFFE
ncbi:hypothetical protein QJS04_geneDACA022825 [Acorus gramineus]|uniref:GIY-YIG domain-containing protein n=1 Tax=Acorus gramineus TaxID=55184 RepID=A0AAV9BPZ1_ACOGR|nr:hypothetical protein QJS04_geneDACA022825 [Acorus gramineus]